MNRNELSNAAGKIQDAYHYALAAQTKKAQARGHESSLGREVRDMTKAEILAKAVDCATEAGMPIPAKFSRHTFFKLVAAWADSVGIDAYRGEASAEAWKAATPAPTAVRMAPAEVRVGDFMLTSNGMREVLAVVATPDLISITVQDVMNDAGTVLNFFARETSRVTVRREVAAVPVSHPGTFEPCDPASFDTDADKLADMKAKLTAAEAHLAELNTKVRDLSVRLSTVQGIADQHARQRDEAMGQRDFAQRGRNRLFEMVTAAGLRVGGGRLEKIAPVPAGSTVE